MRRRLKGISEKSPAPLKRFKFKKETLVVLCRKKIVALRQFKVPSLDAGENSRDDRFLGFAVYAYPAKKW